MPLFAVSETKQDLKFPREEIQPFKFRDDPLSGSHQSQAGWHSEQPDLVEKGPSHCKGIGLGDL